VVKKYKTIEIGENSEMTVFKRILQMVESIITETGDGLNGF
jgi:hypothetical protein